MQVAVPDPSEDTQKLATKTASTFLERHEGCLCNYPFENSKVEHHSQFNGKIISLSAVNVSGNQMFL